MLARYLIAHFAKVGMLVLVRIRSGLSSSLYFLCNLGWREISLLFLLLGNIALTFQATATFCCRGDYISKTDEGSCCMLCIGNKVVKNIGLCDISCVVRILQNDNVTSYNISAFKNIGFFPNNSG